MDVIVKITELLDKGIAAAGGLAVAIDLALRLIKTEKPRSIAWAVADLVKKLAQLLDKVLPQRVAQIEEK